MPHSSKSLTLLSMCALAAACNRVSETVSTSTPAPETIKSSSSVSATKSAVEPEIAREVPSARIDQSSVFDAGGLLHAREWHSALHAPFPQWVKFQLNAPFRMQRISLPPQDGHPEREPKVFRVDTSSDGRRWTPVLSVMNGCDGAADQWHSYTFEKPLTAHNVRPLFESNCGDRDLITLRGVKFE